MPLSLRGARVIIVDADGVFTRLPDGKKLEGIEAFETFLRLPAFQDVLIMVAGEWKRYLTVQRIREFFSEDIAARIVGATPQVENTDTFRSHVEIFEWLDAHPEIANYVVLESSGYAPIPPHVEVGAFVPLGEVFSEAEYGKLVFLLRTPCLGSTQSH